MSDGVGAGCSKTVYKVFFRKKWSVIQADAAAKPSYQVHKKLRGYRVSNLDKFFPDIFSN